MTPDPTPSDLARLREIAEKATPGPWANSHRQAEPCKLENFCHVTYSEVYPALAYVPVSADADFVATFDPPMVLALLTAHAELQARAETAERERDELRLDITGGEDAPGHNASLSHQTIRDILAENYRSWRDSSDRYVTASAQLAAAREAAIGAVASLAAAISLLERSPKTAAPSNKMFDQMLADYRASLEAARAALAPHAEKEEADHG